MPDSTDPPPAPLTWDKIALGIVGGGCGCLVVLWLILFACGFIGGFVEGFTGAMGG